MKKITKFLSAAAGALLVLAAFVGCDQTYTLAEIQLDNPVVTVESKFGYNQLSWDKVELATNYLVYRQEVVTPATDDAAEVLTTRKQIYGLISTKYEVKTFVVNEKKNITEDREVLVNTFNDIIDFENALVADKEYVYTVEAISGDGSRKAVEVFDPNKSYTRGSGVGRVTVKAENVPAAYTKLAAPTEPAVTVTEIENGKEFKVEAVQDAIADGVTVGTVVKAYKLKDLDSVPSCDASGKKISLSFTGSYDLYVANVWIPNDYYRGSDEVDAKKNITIAKENSNKYSIYNCDFYVLTEYNVFNIRYSIPSYLSGANVSILKYTDKNGYYEKLSELDVKKATIIAATSSSTSYNLVDSSVTEGENYSYVLVVSKDGWIGRTSESRTFTKRSATQDSNFTPYIYFIRPKDSDGNVIENKAELYMTGTTEVNKDATVAFSRAKASYTSVGTPEPIKVTQTILGTEEASSSKDKDTKYIWYYYEDKNFAKVNSFNGEYYIFYMTVTEADGSSVTYSKTYQPYWNEYTESKATSTSIAIDPTPASTVTTTTSITIKAKVTAGKDEAGKDLDASKLTVRTVYNYTDDNGVVIYKAIENGTGFNDYKDITISDIPAKKTTGREVQINVIVLDSNGYVLNSTTKNVFTTAAE